MKILHITPTYYPATFWGGPIWSTKAICDAVAKEPDVDLRVLTTDAASPARGDRVSPVDLPYPVHYARRIAGHSIAPGLVARLPSAMAWADVVHLTGVYNTPTLPVFALARLMSKPLVWSPRGALQATADWAEAPKIRLKHNFERALNMLRPAQAVMHVTAASEANASLKRFAGMTTKTIPNTVDVPPLRHTPDRDHMRLIYLGRLHPKKGLMELFIAMQKLPARYILDIYGSGPESYVKLLQQHAQKLQGRIRFHGHVGGADKAAAFAKADLFVLPSHSENFGIAVAEAMAHGVPVLTTTATPWQGLDVSGCGRCMDLGRDDLATEIQTLAAQDLVAMGLRGRDWMARDFSTAAMASAFGRLYRDLANGQTVQVLA